MKLALLGCDADTVALLEQLVRHAGAQLVAVFHGNEYQPRLQALAPSAEWLDEWETLAVEGAWEAVVVGRHRGVPDDNEPLRKLVQAGATMLLAHPACDAITALELEMIRRDSHARLAIHFPGYRHPAWTRVAELAAQGESSPVGRIEQLVFERVLRQRDRVRVIEQLARDAALARLLIGPLSRVSATAPTQDDSAWSNLAVQMSGKSDVLVRWSAMADHSGEASRLTLVGTKGRATLAMPVEGDWRIEFPGSAAAQSISRDDAQRASCERLAAWLALGGPDDNADSEWSGVCRDLEVAEAAEVSLRRGKVIEIHHETVTEEDTFKGVMSAVGCLLLTLVPVILIVAVMIEGFRHGWHHQMNVPSTSQMLSDRPDSPAIPGATSGLVQGEPAAGRYWLICILAPLLIFLGLQSLRLVFRAPPKA